MPILIKDMEMPRGCFDCYFSDLYYDSVWTCDLAENEVTEFVDKRPDWCPLVEVKRPKYDVQLLRDCGMED